MARKSVKCGALAALLLVVEFFASRAMRVGRLGWAHLALLFGALLAELFNAFVHTIDGWTAVVPTGMVLSIIGAILAMLAVAALLFVPIVWIELRSVQP